MDPQPKALLEETLALSKENNKMLHSMKRSMRLARVMSIFYWVIIIGSAVGAYYYIEPYLDQLMNVYGSAKGNLDSINSLFKEMPKDLPR